MINEQSHYWLRPILKSRTNKILNKKQYDFQQLNDNKMLELTLATTWLGLHEITFPLCINPELYKKQIKL